MKPVELRDYLSTLISSEITLSTMIWGAPGIGKSSIVRAIAEDHDLGFTDLRLSQLAPTDLRGLPAPKDGMAAWLPPEFLPREGRGILFLDEINMAPPALQGVAQQLILDRAVGSYRVPDGWFVWAAGNRKEDRAAVFDMPAPLSNRFLHLAVEPDIADFRQYAYANGVHESIIAFLAYRSQLLHKVDANNNAWPSPRSWEMASQLLEAKLDIASAVGDACASEFYAYLQAIHNVPDLDAIVTGKKSPAFPGEPSLSYATVMGLVSRCDLVKPAMNAFAWLADKANPEWVQLFAADLFPRLRSRKLLSEFQREVVKDASLSAFMNDFTRLLTEA